MTDSARPSTHMLQQIRSSFGQGSTQLPSLTPTSSVPSTPSSVVNEDTSTQQQLEVLEQVLQEVEQQTVAQAIPLAVTQATDTLNPQQVTVGVTKEATDRGAQIEQIVDAGAGAQTIEIEPSPEISPEVAEFLQKVEEHQDQLPQEIVIASDAAQLLPATQALKPVIILPITPEIEAVGAKKNTQWSVRWLIEWSRRLMKMFSGKILYAESDS